MSKEYKTFSKPLSEMTKHEREIEFYYRTIYSLYEQLEKDEKENNGKYNYHPKIYTKVLANVFYCLEEYKKLLDKNTPPTELEVCEALSEYYGREVIYDYFEERFYKKGIKKQWVRITNLYDFKIKAPHLITMIGRFYEGEVKGE